MDRNLYTGNLEVGNFVFDYAIDLISTYTVTGLYLP